MESKPYWKKIWYIVTMRSMSITEEDVEQVLKLIDDDIFKGVLQYEYYSDESFTKWKKSISSTSPNLERVIQRLGIKLNMHCEGIWSVFCNYLMFEYNGKVNEVANMAIYDIQLTNLSQALYMFYSRERSFMLRSIIYILDKTVNRFDLSHCYDVIVNKHTISKIRKSLTDQIKHLIEEITPATADNCVDMKHWVNRNYFEQFEVSLAYLLTLKNKPMTFEDMLEFLNVTMDYACTQLLPYDKIKNIIDLKLKNAVKYTQFAVMLIGYDQIYPHCNEKQIEQLVRATDCRIETVVLLWSLIHTNHDTRSGKQAELEVYKEILDEATEDDILNLLLNILSCDMLADSCGGYMIQKWVFDFYNDTVALYQNCDILNDKTVKILALTLKNYDIAQCVTNSLPPPPIFNLAFKMFPHDFSSYTRLLNCLAEHDSICVRVFQILTNCMLYTEKFGEPVGTHESRRIDKEFRPRHSNKDCELAPIVFPVGTLVNLWMHKTDDFATFYHKYNYFTVLCEQFHQLVYKEQFEDLSKEIEKSVVGLELMTSLLTSTVLTASDFEENYEFTFSATLVKSIFTNALTHKSHDLVYRCLRALMAISKFTLKQVVDILLVSNFLPVYTSYTLSLKYSLETGSMTNSILLEYIHMGCQSKDAKFLLAYLEFFMDCYHKRAFFKKILMPGISYIYTHIFLRHMDWEYINQNQKHQISAYCMELTFNILQKDPKDSTEDEKQMYNFVLDSFGPQFVVLNKFVHLIRSTFYNINTMMEIEVDWDKGQRKIIFKVLKYCLTVLMIFLNNYDETDVFKKICHRCLSLDVRPNLVKLIVGIMAQDYNLSMCRQACHVLKKIIEKLTSVSLMAYLDMDRTQIQGVFLYKLRDPVEEDEIKLLILDIITYCVYYGQHGMCAALFNINTLKSDRKLESTGDSVTIFLAEHLKSLVTETEYINSPLQKPMLHLFYTLWTCRRSSMISKLTKEKDFWPILAEQLFKPMILEDDSVAKILDILMVEIIRNLKNVDPNLKNVIRRIYDLKEYFLIHFHQYILDSIEADGSKAYGEKCNSLRVVWSWKNFMTVSVKYTPECFEGNDAAKVEIADYCLRGLQRHLLHPGDVKIFSAFSDLYFFCITEWGPKCYGNVEERLELLTEIFLIFFKYVEIVKLQDKESLLAVAAKTVIDVTEMSPHTLEKFEDFLNSVIPVLHMEYKILQYLTEDKEMRDIRAFAKAHRNWNAIILLGSSLLRIPGSEKYAWWYRSAQFVEKIMYFVGLFIKHQETMHCAKLAISFLVKYAESPLYMDFAHIDMKDFYFNINPPSIFDNTKLTLENFDIEQMDDWWYTYRGILAMNIILMQRLDVLIRDNVFYLFTLQSHVVKQLLLLPKATAEIAALKVVKMILLCFNVTLKWKDTWRYEFPFELKLMVDTLSETMNQCVLILLRPKLISAYRLGDKSQGIFLENMPEKIFLHIIEQIIDILSLILTCFMKINPPVLDVLDFWRPSDLTCLKVQNEYLFNLNHKTTFSHYIFHALHILCKASSLIQTKRTNTLKYKRIDNDADEILMYQEHRYFIYIMNEDMHRIIDDRLGSQSIFKHQEISGISAPWLGHLNVDIVNNTLEKLVAFLTQQVWYSSVTQLSLMQGDMLKRKIQADLQVFQDYLKKKVQEKHQCPVPKKPSYSRRRKEFEDENAFQHSFDLRAVDNTKEVMDSTIDDEFLVVMSVLLQRATKLTFPSLFA